MLPDEERARLANAAIEAVLAMYGYELKAVIYVEVVGFLSLPPIRAEVKLIPIPNWQPLQPPVQPKELPHDITNANP